MLKRLILGAAALLCVTGAFAASVKNYSLLSPDGKVEVRSQVGQTVSWSLFVDGKEIIAPSQLSMTLADGTVWGEGSRFIKKFTRSVDKTEKAINYKKSKVRDCFNELMLCFKGFNIEFRAYDEGVAYRFVAKSDKPLTVKDEGAQFRFAADWNSFVPFVRHGGSFEEQFHSSFESLYTRGPLSGWKKGRLAFLPMLVDADGLKLCITESDLLNYPGMYLLGEGKPSLKGVFAPYPAKWEQGGHFNLEEMRLAREDYIARVPGDMFFPWRLVGIAREDKDLIGSDLVYNTARPAAEGSDWSWVRPGMVCWDWWSNWNLFGVDFKAGINNETYKYFIDFAAANGIPYVLLDEGWSPRGAGDMLQIIPELDLPMLAEYGRSKGVGLILWVGCAAFDKDMEEGCRRYSEMGIKGFKVDYMNYDDQVMVDFYRRAAETAAKYRLILDFHGAFKPAGLPRTYPNVLGFEGVYGMENVKWIKDTPLPEYDVTIPYIRMFAGFMDYTQGAMRNSTKDKYQPDRSRPMSQGTRCHQIAEYIVFDSPFNMLSDTPSLYLRERECLDLLTSLPTVWDETVPIGGKVGESVAVARRSGKTWYVGALTNWDKRDMTLDFSFLPAGQWKVTIFRDGVNVDKEPCDYTVQKDVPLNNGDTLLARMASGGGWFAKIEKL